MNRDELREYRKQMFAKMEQGLKEMLPKEEDSMFYYHPSEERIVLTHALFWVMSQTLRGRIRQGKHLLLLRQYEEEMLDAFLTDDEQFHDLLRYCNILCEILPIILPKVHDMKRDKEARKLAAITVVAGGYGGDMPDELANELLDDMDFYRGRVKCGKIEGMLPELNRMVEREMQ